MLNIYYIFKDLLYYNVCIYIYVTDADMYEEFVEHTVKTLLSKEVLFED